MVLDSSLRTTKPSDFSEQRAQLPPLLPPCVLAGLHERREHTKAPCLISSTPINCRVKSEAFEWHEGLYFKAEPDCQVRWVSASCNPEAVSSGGPLG